MCWVFSVCLSRSALPFSLQLCMPQETNLFSQSVGCFMTLVLLLMNPNKPVWG